ncbi:hypothetical protein GS528_16410 [Rhodococcus hoagii]|nr:hypothetical protein [Prescottella equi]
MTVDLDKLEQLKAAVCNAESATEWINALNNAVPDLIAELREARAAIERVRALTRNDHYAFEVATDYDTVDGQVVWTNDLIDALDGARD